MQETEKQRLSRLKKAASAYCIVIAIGCLTWKAFPQVLGWGDEHIRPHTPVKAVEKQSLLNSQRSPDAMFRSRVDLVLVPVTVRDPTGRPVSGLERQHFEVYEDKNRQDIRYFAGEDVPVSLGLILDVSGSMASKIERAREAVLEFCRTANPQDEFFLITFADRPESQVDFTQAIDNLDNRMVSLRAAGRTALLDAIYLGLANMREAKYPRKALLVISDGGDNHSRYKEREVKRFVMEADTIIYSIGMYDYFFATGEERFGPQLLSDIAEVSGGRDFTIDNPNDLADVARKIGIEIRNQYLLGYSPRNLVRDGRWRKIKVKLRPPKGFPPSQLSAKSGYYASSE